MTASVTLSRPAGSAQPIQRNPVRADGFEFPTFKLLNNKTRIQLSPNPANIDNRHTFCHFAISNAKGWFAAIINVGTTSAIILGPLAALRTAITSSQSTFTPSRTLNLPSYATHISFAMKDTCLMVGLDNGVLAAYDCAVILSAGPSVDPSTSNTFGVRLRGIAPNPSSEEGLCDLVALARDDGTAVIVDQSLHVKVEFKFEAPELAVSAVSWSPKGRHLAVGTRSGNIFTYIPSDQPSQHLHIPSTASGVLATVNWIGPGHTFRTTYSPMRDAAGQQMGEPVQHGIYVDHRTGNTTVFETTHPYPNVDRPPQNSYAAILPRFDEEPGDNLVSKYLLVVADPCSVDLEIIASDSKQWYQQSQDNPLSLPLDKNSEDTIPLFLGTDLTDPSGVPIMVAYLNDGTVQAWYINHSRPYACMVSSPSVPSSAPPSSIQPAKSMDAESTTPSKPPPSFPQQAPPSPFGEPAFGQTGFGSQATPSRFGQGAASTMSGGSAFGSQATAPLGSGFSTSQPPAFGAPSTTNAFSQQPQAAAASLFGSGTGPAFAQSGPAFSNTTTSTAPPATETPDASMDATTPDGFGGLSLSGNTPASTSSPNSFGIFGQAAALPASSQPTGSGSLIQAGKGAFGSSSAFGGTASTFGAGGTSAFIQAGSGAFGGTPSGPFSSPSANSTNVASSGSFGQASTLKPSASPAFGQTSFGAAKPSPSFGQTGFGSSSAKGFSSFASGGTAAFGASKPSETKPPAQGGGFSAFASQGASAFGSTTPASQASGFGKFASNGSSAFGKPMEQSSSLASTSQPPVFGSTSQNKAPFSQSSESMNETTSTLGADQKPPESKPSTSTGGGFASFAGAGTSAFGAKPTSVFSASAADSNSSLKAPTRPDGTSFFGPSDPVSSQSMGSAFSPPPQSPTSAFGHTSSLFKPGADASKQALQADTPSSKDTNASKTAPMTTSTPPAPAPETSSLMKPAKGFGTLSASNTTSAFSNPGELKVSSAFSEGKLSSPVQTSAPTTTPVFGSLSLLGSGSKKPLFQKETPASHSGVTLGGFSAYAKKAEPSSTQEKRPSFSDLLKGKPASGDNIPTMKPKEEPSEAAISSDKPASTSVPLKGPESSILTPKREPEPETPELSSPPRTPVDEAAPSPAGSATLKKELSGSFVSSSSQASSYVDVSAEVDDEGRESDGLDSGSEYVPEDEVDDFLSEIEEVTEEGSAASEHEDDTSDSLGNAVSKPLPPSRSSSSTPQPMTRPPSLTPPAGKEKSTSPPGSPDKKLSPSPVKPAPTPSLLPLPVAQSSGTSRPLKSSPLARSSSINESNTSSEKSPTSTTTPKPPVGAFSFPASAAGLAPFPGPPKPTSLTGQLPPGGLFNLGSNPLTSGIFSSPPPAAPGPPATPTKNFGTSFTAQASAFVTTPTPFKTPAPATPGTPTPQVAGAKPGTAPSFFGTSPLAGSPSLGGTAPAPMSPLFPPLPQQQQRVQAPVVTSATPLIAVPPPEVPQEQGMQRECARLVIEMDKELDKLREDAARAHQTLETYRKPHGGSKSLKELGEASKWGVADSKMFMSTLRHIEKDLDELQKQRAVWNEDQRTIKGLMIRAGTRKEEISRFTKAQTDAEVARMIKSRSLPPEYAESQTQLRREVRNIQTRVPQLEASLSASKKKLSEFQTGRTPLKPPTLDTVNRTYRNIDRALFQQEDELERLRRRISKLDPSYLNSGAFKRSKHRSPEPDPRLPDKKANLYMTPDVATRTAAALNAERSAQKVKQVLLGIHKDPVVNRTALNTTATPPQAFNTPKKPEVAKSTAVMFNNSPLSGSMFSNIPPLSSASLAGIPDTALPSGKDDNFHPMPFQTSGRRGAGVTGRMHSQGVRLPPKNSTSPAPSSGTKNVPEGFSWGPLPAFPAVSKPKDSNFVSFTK